MSTQGQYPFDIQRYLIRNDDDHLLLHLRSLLRRDRLWPVLREASPGYQVIRAHRLLPHESQGPDRLGRGAPHAHRDRAAPVPQISISLVDGTVGNIVFGDADPAIHKGLWRIFDPWGWWGRWDKRRLEGFIAIPDAEDIMRRIAQIEDELP